MQIPDDLSPPDESDAIRLPSDVGVGGPITAGACLEEPPPFFGDSRPFVDDADQSDESRRQRREARRAARAESQSSPEAPSDAEPAEQGDPPPAGDDRVIDN